MTPTTMAIKAPIADNPAPGPIYGMAGSGKRQATNMIRIADKNIWLRFMLLISLSVHSLLKNLA